MKLVGRPVLEALKREHSNVAKRIDAFCAEIQSFTWTSPLDVKQSYNSVDFPGNNQAIFNIKGNQYRVLAQIDYQRGIVVIKKAGTHAEYNDWRIK